MASSPSTYLLRSKDLRPHPLRRPQCGWSSLHPYNPAMRMREPREVERLAQGHRARNWQNSHPGPPGVRASSAKPSPWMGFPQPGAHAGGSHQGGLTHTEALRGGSKREEPTAYPRGPPWEIWDSWAHHRGRCHLGGGEAQSKWLPNEGRPPETRRPSTCPRFRRRGD